MASASPPPRPSRANTDNLNDVYASQPTTLAQRRTSASMPINQNGVFYADPNEQVPPIASTSQSPSQIRSRAGTTKGKKGMLGFMSDFLGSNKTVAISTPYDPVHLTHVGFNSSTGEFTGLPKEWQQLLQESGISRVEQEKNPQAVMEIVKFYQEGGGDVWDKMGAAPAPPRDDADSSGISQSPVSHSATCGTLYAGTSTTCPSALFPPHRRGYHPILRLDPLPTDRRPRHPRLFLLL